MRFFAVLLIAVFAAGAARAGALRVVVKDPSAAAVPDAAVRVTSTGGLIAGTKTTGADGTALFGDLAAGDYAITVQHDGFEPAEAKAGVPGEGEATAQVSLKIARQETAVEVSSAAPGTANSDPNYRALRERTVAESFTVENLELKRDAAVFELKKGTLSFTAPVMGRVVVAVFSGEGKFQLSPAMRLEAERLKMVTGEAEVHDEFDSAVFLFTDATYDELKASLKTPAEGARNADVLRNFRRLVRHRTDLPRSFTEYLLQGDGVRNIDAEILGELYNPKFGGSFRAYLHGHRYPDLRFLVNPRGATPELLSTEEVALINVDPMGEHDGILYLTHYASEWKSNTALQHEDKRIAAAVHYQIETVIGKNEHLASAATIRLEPVRDGDRVIDFELLPNLRVSRVSVDGKDVEFVQEGRKLDGGFYVILPAPMEKGKPQEIRVEYQGDKVVHNEGGGTFSVRARESWYPSLNVFRDRATYDLTFKVPRQYTLVSVGKLADKGREQDYAVTHWVASVPISVAGFNYGDFKLKQVADGGTDFEAYATEELPDYLRMAHVPGAMIPSAMAANTMIDAENAVRCFTYWFGKLPYGRVAITQQPQMNFGQSWPTLVYLPLFSFLDATQRYFFLGGNTFRAEKFFDEVTSHEVSHQWWGHLVGWNSYHDQWLSEGFADFSAGLFLQATEKSSDKYRKYWETGRKEIVDKNNWGNAATDAGPIWMGLRLNSFKNEEAYRQLVYPKGGYVLHMLRYLMQDPKTGDDDFIAMMHDFTAQFAFKNASTEDFQAIVEKHMKPQMDLEGNKRMSWFFRQYVYGTEVGSYNLAYSLADQPDGSALLTGKITQSGVSDGFRIRVPIYVDFGNTNGPMKLANIAVTGNAPTSEFKLKLPKAAQESTFELQLRRTRPQLQSGRDVVSGGAHFRVAGRKGDGRNRPPRDGAGTDA